MTDGDAYLIWSNEHRAWWGPGRNGYVSRLSEAGRYSQFQAFEICADAIAGTALRLGMLPEVPVREVDLEFVRKLFKASYPNSNEIWE